MGKIDSKQLTDKIQNYRDNGKSCSQSVLTGICTTVDCKLSEEELLSLGKGFSGGIGGTFEKAAVMSKQALTRKVGTHSDKLHIKELIYSQYIKHTLINTLKMDL